MRLAIITISVFALLFTLTAELAHAHLVDQSTQNHISVETDNNQDKNNTTGSDECEMVCSVHHHHIGSSNNDSVSLYDILKDKNFLAKDVIYISDYIYGLKRPPKA